MKKESGTGKELAARAIYQHSPLGGAEKRVAVAPNKLLHLTPAARRRRRISFFSNR
jgi:hypothetical protein